jgi:septum formation protein
VASHHRYALVVGADQILVCGEKSFSKPTDLDDARAQLLALRGRARELVTVACVDRETVRIWHTVVFAKLTIRHCGDGFLGTYIDSEKAEILGSLGSYRVVGKGIQLFSNIDGDYFSIHGLPLLELLSFFRTRGALVS